LTHANHHHRSLQMSKAILLVLLGLAVALKNKHPGVGQKKAGLKVVKASPSASSSSSAIPDIPKAKMQVPQVSETLPFAGESTSNALFSKKTKCQGFIEELKVVGGGAAYVSKIYVGYKEFTCLPDTGSFDLEIIAHDAERFNGTGYDRNQSKFHRRFPILAKETEDLMFGSGPARIRKAMDLVALVKGGEAHQTCRANQCPVGAIIKTSIRELLREDASRDFDAICGIGLGPKDKLQHRLVSQMGVKRVGFCFRKETSEGGIAHWNYKVKEQKARGFQFSTVNVIGPYWGMAVTSARAEMGTESTVFACQDAPCLAVVDTGTTLHSMDSASLSKFRKIIGDRELTCDESLFKVLPTLCYSDENGKNLCLKPHDYVYKMSENYSFKDLPAFIRESLAFTPETFPNFRRKGKSEPECVLAIGDSGEKNMHVLGMQWFKSHWFGFDTVSSAISWSKHDGSCNPEKKDFHQILDEPKLLEFDPTKIRPSTLSLRLKQAKKAGPEFYQSVREQIGLAQLD